MHLHKAFRNQSRWANYFMKSSEFLCERRTIFVRPARHIRFWRNNHVHGLWDIQKLEEHLGYFENNRDRMKYDEYLEQGYPIGSGVVEGACRNLVKDRMERTGMRWCVDGAQAILDLRAVYLNDDWNQFHKYLIRREQKRIYPHRRRLIQSFQSPS